MMAEKNASSDGFTTAKTRRRARPRPCAQKDEEADKDYKRAGAVGGGNRRRVRQMEMNTHPPIWQGLRRRPNVQWDYRSFSILVAKSDEKAIGAGLEKMISERRLMGSYNWDVDSWIPTIVVPGAPKIFSVWKGGVLESRNQFMTIDEESFRIPNAPMEPLFTAVRLCQPNFKLDDIDLVADLNCLKKLLRFVLHATFSVDAPQDSEGGAMVQNKIDIDKNIFAGSGNDCEFRIDCQVLGNTVVMTRREMEHRGRAMGYGIGYLDACTKLYDADLTASGPHKRITYVKLGDIRLLLRHKALAAIYPPETAGQEQQSLAVAAGGGDGCYNGRWPSSMQWSTVRCARGGYLGDHTGLAQIEFASVSKERRSKLVIDKWLDMLFIGSDHLYLGEHIRGRFDQPTMRTRSDALDLSGLKPSDGRRILYVLEMVLEKIVRYGRRTWQDGKGKGKDGGGGDGDGKKITTEPFSFAIVSADECRRLELYKFTPSKKNASGNQQSAPNCVSESMMAALVEEN